jgi:signal transduction histidine kinase
MFERRSLRWPITLGVVMIVLVVLLIVGWVLVLVWNLRFDNEWTALYITLLSVGATFLAFILVGVVMYLTLSIKAINLSRRQSNFIDSVTHELKSPIASLKLYLQTLNRRPVPPEEQATFFRDMLEDVERLDSLINHLLDAARLEKDRTPAEKDDVDVSEVIRGVTEKVCLQHQSPRETVRLALDPCTVYAAPVDLELIFRNLIDNAVKYASDEGPLVEVELHCADDSRVVARISDNGPGIPLKYRSKLFGRFIRIGSELERAKPGTGLGLYIVRTLVHRLGGKIEIRDRDGGRGTTFEVHLPGKSWPAEPAAGEAA